MNVTITGFTIQTVQTVNKKSVLVFYVEERVGEWDPSDF